MNKNTVIVAVASLAALLGTAGCASTSGVAVGDCIVPDYEHHDSRNYVKADCADPYVNKVVGEEQDGQDCPERGVVWIDKARVKGAQGTGDLCVSTGH